jgi:hypothetical protein
MRLIYRMSKQMIPLTVKLPTGDLISIEIPEVDPYFYQEEIAYKIQEVDPSLPHYLQTIHILDPETDEPFRRSYRISEAQLFLTMAPADVYLEPWDLIQRIHSDPIRFQLAEEYHVYCVRSYHDAIQHTMYYFVEHENQYYCFTNQQTKSRKPFHEYLLEQLSFSPTLAEALSSIPEVIRDAIVEKWDKKDFNPAPYPDPFDEESWSDMK